MALVTNNISGSSSDSSKIGITGSVIISNRGDAQFPSIGSDAVLFVSGSETAKSVFGGAAKISGSLSTDGNVTLGNSSDDILIVSGTSQFVRDVISSTDIIASGTLKSLNSTGDEGGEVFLSKPVTNTTLNTGVTIDVYQNRVRIFETGGTNRGGYYDISALSAGVGTNLASGGGSGAPTGAQYVTLATNASLTDERVLTAGSGISITDGGAGSTVTISATGTSDPSAQYLVLASTASLSNERTFTPGTGLTGTDGGANSNYVLAINDSVVATVSGTSFTGPISSTGFTSTDRVLITSGSSRTISQAGALIYDSTNQYLGIGTTPSRNVHVANGFRLGSAGSYVEWVGVNSTITRITVGGTQTTLEMNQDTLFPPNKTLGFQSALASAKDSGFSRAAAGIINVSGSAPGALFRFNASSTPLSAGDLGMNTTTGRPNALIGGVARELAHVAEIAPSTASYVVIGLDSSLPNDRVLTAGSGISITDGGAGSTITISATGGGSGGADAAASYVVLSATSSLSNERVLAAGSGISITDGGPGGSVTIAATGGGGGGGDTYFSSTTAGSIFTSGSAAFKGNEFVDSPADKGTDVFFYVSGSTTQKALFGGDVRVSGSLTVGTGSITLTSNDIQFGSSTNRLELSGSKLKLFDGANTSGITLGSDLILVESKYITGDTQTITFSNLDGDRDRAYYLIMNRAQGGSSTSFEIRPNGTTSNLVGYYHFISSAGPTHTAGSYGSSISFGGSIASGSFGTLEVVFSATRFSRSRVFNLRHNYVVPGTPSYNQNSVIGVWSDTSTLLTSLDIYGSTSSAFVSGTHVHLYKLRNA